MSNRVDVEPSANSAEIERSANRVAVPPSANRVEAEVIQTRDVYYFIHGGQVVITYEEVRA